MPRFDGISFCKKTEKSSETEEDMAVNSLNFQRAMKESFLKIDQNVCSFNGFLSYMETF